MAARTNWIGALLLMAATAVAADSGMAEIDELDAHCRKTSDPPRHVGASCAERLGWHFASAPIWEGTTVRYTYGGRAHLHWSVLSDRNSLPYTRADLLPGDAPVWSDVFDGGIERRVDVAARVFEDPACAALDGVGGIKPELSGRCEARELFKYAAYLDACMTGLDRVRHLHDPVMRDGTSRYENAEEMSGRSDYMRTDMIPPPPPPENAEEAARRDRSSLMEMSLLSMWVSDRCSAMPARMFDGDLRPIRKPDGLSDHRKLAVALKPAHDAAMAIAARAGDPWAVQAFFVKGKGLAHDIEYWRSLHGFNPLLFHRWMTQHVGSALGLSPEERALHALKAFAIERRSRPDLEIGSYVANYRPYDRVARKPVEPSWRMIDPSWRDGSAPPDASALDESLVYPWETERGRMLLDAARNRTR